MSGLVIVLIASLFLAAFAATAETALTSVSRLRMRSLAETGDRAARRVVRLHEQPNAYLSTILMVNTLAVIVASTVTTLLVVDRWGTGAEAASTAVLSVVVLVACEILPKSVALRFNERVARLVSGPVTTLTQVLRPLVFLLTWLSSQLVRLIARGVSVPGPFVTEDELKLLLAVSEREGVVEEEEREMISGVLELTDKVVREVMVPRVDVVGVEVRCTVDDVIRMIAQSGHSRIPLFEDTIDNVVGLVYAKDLLRAVAAHTSPPPSLRELAREPYFTPELKKAGELLIEMKKKKVHLAIVVDEYGGTAGIVTIEDLIEEIVGDIRDEYDAAEPEEVQFVTDREVLVNARVALDDIKALLRLPIDDDLEADTIGGLVYERLGSIPKAGATVQIGDVTIRVESVRRQAIRTLRISSPRPLRVEVEETSHERNGAAGALGGEH
ncbi:MAG TPA: hemolysin family protein [Candidatus Dormibacteraeota bacterium]|nr:hemolysin family protein [Candidatus Dormibacteraeota bacterium]